MMYLTSGSCRPSDCWTTVCCMVPESQQMESQWSQNNIVVGGDAPRSQCASHTSKPPSKFICTLHRQSAALQPLHRCSTMFCLTQAKVLPPPLYLDGGTLDVLTKFCLQLKHVHIMPPWMATTVILVGSAVCSSVHSLGIAVYVAGKHMQAMTVTMHTAAHWLLVSWYRSFSRRSTHYT